jgi:hypothetical protein
MRRDGDRLLDHLASARQSVTLCAPFIKAGVLSSLLRHIPTETTVKVITRWLPLEVAVGVSDLEIFDIVAARSGASLWLLDRLHAKLYVADGRVLGGSANLTGAALGWSPNPNLELLTELSPSDDAVQCCLAQLEEARPATAEERERVRKLADGTKTPKIALVDDVEPDAEPTLWLPSLGAPAKLYQAYYEPTRGRLPPDVLDAATADLVALDLPTGLSEADFHGAVAQRLIKMPAIQRLLGDAADGLADDTVEGLVAGRQPRFIPLFEFGALAAPRFSQDDDALAVEQLRPAQPAVRPADRQPDLRVDFLRFRKLTKRRSSSTYFTTQFYRSPRRPSPRWQPYPAVSFRAGAPDFGFCGRPSTMISGGPAWTRTRNQTVMSGRL